MTAQRSRSNKIAYKMTFTGVKPAIIKPASADNSKDISFFEGTALVVEAAGENVVAHRVRDKKIGHHRGRYLRMEW